MDCFSLSAPRIPACLWLYSVSGEGFLEQSILVDTSILEGESGIFDGDKRFCWFHGGMVYFCYTSHTADQLSWRNTYDTFLAPEWYKLDSFRI